MREQNPAITLYQQYRNIISWRAERHVTKMRNDYRSHAERKPDSTPLTSEEIEERIIAGGKYSSRYQRVPLNYRMNLRVFGLSDAHLDNERLFDDLDDWEPIIELSVNQRPLFQIWPDGRFHFDDPPSMWHQAMPEYVTFLRTSYAAGRRVWLVNNKSMPHGTWVNLNEKDWTNPVPYVRNYDLIAGVFYRIVPAENGHWKFQGVESPHVVTHERLLDEGYRVAENRYDRYKRAHERDAHSTYRRNRIAMYVPRHGLVTGTEAVNRFSQHIRVYEPTRP